MELEGLVFQPLALECVLVLSVVVAVQCLVELEGLVFQHLVLEWVLLLLDVEVVQLPVGLEGLVFQPLGAVAVGCGGGAVACGA